jgi:hypothetical protein
MKFVKRILSFGFFLFFHEGFYRFKYLLKLVVIFIFHSADLAKKAFVRATIFLFFTKARMISTFNAIVLLLLSTEESPG